MTKRRWIVLAVGCVVVLTACYALSGKPVPGLSTGGLITAKAPPGTGPGSPAFGAPTPMGPFKGWVVGLDTTPPPSTPKPKLNEPFADPTYNTTISRVTDAAQVTDGTPPAFVRHEYSRRPSFNVDSSRALMVSSDGWLRLYDVDKVGNRMRFVKTLKVGGSVEPNWDPKDPNVFYHFGANGVGLQIFKYDVRTDAGGVARDLTSAIKALYPQAESLWTKEEGRPSKDNKIWCMMVERYVASTQQVTHFGFVAYDFESNKILGHLDTRERPDHISASPLGNYCVPSSDGPMGTRAYSLDFSKHVQLHVKSEHSDLGLDKAGKEIYVYSDYSSGPHGGYVVMARLEDGKKTNLLRIYGANHSATAVHISGVAMDKPGYFLVDFDNCTENYSQAPCDPKAQWFYDKVVIVELGDQPKLYNLAHTHFGSSGYWGETQSVANRDMTKVLFGSSWGSKQESDVSSYMVDVPPLP